MLHRKREYDSTGYLMNSNCVNHVWRVKTSRKSTKSFKNEHEYGLRNGIQIKKESFSAQINQELHALQPELPLLSLEMQIILTFMDEKRWAIQQLLSILISTKKDKFLKKKNFRGLISDNEYQELKKDLSRDTIANSSKSSIKS